MTHARLTCHAPERTIARTIARCFALLSLALVAITPARAQDLIHKAPPQQMPIAITGGTLHTGDGRVIENAWIQIRDGRIADLGTGDRLFTADHILVDARGKHIYPGLISPVTILGLTEIGAVRATHDSNETGQFTPEVRASVAVNPDSTLLPVARSGGILIAGVFPRGGRVSGSPSAIRLDGWTTEDMTIVDRLGIAVSFPQVRPVTDWWMTRPVSEQQERIDENLAELADFFDRLEAYAAAKAAGQEIPVDQGLEAAMIVLPGENQKPVFVRAQDLDQITAAVTFFTDRGMRPVIVGGRDAPLCADLLKAHDVPVIIPGTQAFPKRADLPHDHAYTLPARLEDLGVRWCLASGDEAANERNLPHQAGKAVAFGLDPETAVSAMTLRSAQILGIDDAYGSIAKGKSATLVICDGDILEVASNVEWACIDGRVIDLQNKHTQLRDKYLDKYRQMGLIQDD